MSSSCMHFDVNSQSFLTWEHLRTHITKSRFCCWHGPWIFTISFGILHNIIIPVMYNSTCFDQNSWNPNLGERSLEIIFCRSKAFLRDLGIPVISEFLILNWSCSASTCLVLNQAERFVPIQYWHHSAYWVEGNDLNFPPQSSKVEFNFTSQGKGGNFATFKGKKRLWIEFFHGQV